MVISFLQDSSLMRRDFEAKRTRENTLEEVVEVAAEFDYEIFLQQSFENAGVSEEISSMYIMADTGYIFHPFVCFEYLHCP